MARITKADLKQHLTCTIELVESAEDGVELEIQVTYDRHHLYTVYSPATNLDDLDRIAEDAEQAAADEEIDDETLIRAFAVEYRSGESEDAFESRRVRAEKTIAVEVGRRAAQWVQALPPA
jgi:hypothetical protein